MILNGGRRSLLFQSVSEDSLNIYTEDEDTTVDTSTGQEPSTDNTEMSPDNSGSENEDNTESNDDFNINADLSDDDTDDSDDIDNSDSSSGSMGGDSSNEMMNGDEESEEPVQANTDIFKDLSEEEQSIKIAELKRMYQDLYTSVDDFVEKISTIDPDENNLKTLNRCSSTLYRLKQFISDYLIDSFPNKSYIENDIAFNRFLTILNSVGTVVEDLAKLKTLK